MKALLNIILTPFKMIWSIFDNDAHRIVSKKGLNLLQMENKLDKQLAKETPSSLIEWMQSKIELSECVNCDEVKQTHQICMDCIGKLIKENQESLYTEEDVLAAIEVGFDLGKNFDNDNPNIGLGWLIYQKDNFIKSLKQK